MNFTKFPDINYSIPELTYYKPLFTTNPPTTEIDENNNLELWNVEPYQIKNVKPKWTWNIVTKDFLPILNPCNPNWNIRWTKNGNIIKDTKIKRFNRNKDVDCDSFVFIEELSEE